MDYQESRAVRLDKQSRTYNCATPQPTVTVIVPALRRAAGLPGRRVHVSGCEPDAVAPSADGYAAVEACGSPDAFGVKTGPASLVTVDRALHVTSRAPLGSCLWSGVELAAGANGSSLLGVYTYFCAANVPLPPVTAPRDTVLFTDTTQHLHGVLDASDGGLEIYSCVSW